MVLTEEIDEAGREECCVRQQNQRRLMEHMLEVFVRLFRMRDTDEMHGYFEENQSVD